MGCPELTGSIGYLLLSYRYVSEGREMPCRDAKEIVRRSVGDGGGSCHILMPSAKAKSKQTSWKSNTTEKAAVTRP